MGLGLSLAHGSPEHFLSHLESESQDFPRAFKQMKEHLTQESLNTFYKDAEKRHIEKISFSPENLLQNVETIVKYLGEDAAARLIKSKLFQLVMRHPRQLEMAVKTLKAVFGDQNKAQAFAAKYFDSLYKVDGDKMRQTIQILEEILLKKSLVDEVLESQFQTVMTANPNWLVENHKIAGEYLEDAQIEELILKKGFGGLANNPPENVKKVISFVKARIGREKLQTKLSENFTAFFSTNPENLMMLERLEGTEEMLKNLTEHSLGHAFFKQIGKVDRALRAEIEILKKAEKPNREQEPLKTNGASCLKLFQEAG